MRWFTKLSWSAFFFVFSLSATALAQTFVGTFVMTKGDVKVLREPKSHPKGPFLIYQGQKYAYEEARIGKKILPAELVHTGTDGRAKVVYANGDHFNLGPGSSMSMPAPKGNNPKAEGSKLNLFYGKVRSLISKKGPRTKMEVKTPSATAGVRGTDFFLRHSPTEGSQLSVLRGEVSLQKEATSKAVSVTKGFTAKVETPNATESPAATETIQVEPATKEEIVEIQKETALKPDEKAIEELPSEVKEQVAELSSKSTTALAEDIKADDPEFYEQIKNQLNESNADAVYDINTKVVANLYEKAPGEIKKKPTSEELEAIGQDVYNRYFRSVK